MFLQLKNKKIIYPKKISNKAQIIKQDNKSQDNKNNREFGVEISNNIKKKDKNGVKFPYKSKENTNNNIFTYPKIKSKNEVDNNNKKKNPPKRLNRPNKSKINLIIEKINNNQIDSNEIIYNANPIEEYEQEIMNNLFKEETKNRANYSLFPNISDKTNNFILLYLKRFSFINLFILFQNELALRQETLYLTINLFDRYIQKINSEKIKNNLNSDLYLIALTCLFIAAKYEEIYPPYLGDFLDIFNKKYTKRDVLLKEDEILSSLDFQVLITSPLLFLKKFSLNEKCENEEIKNDLDLCFFCAQFFLELCIIEPKFCELKPSLESAICLYLARKFLLNDKKGNNNNKVWTFDLFFKTNYSEIEIKRYIKIPLKIIKNFFGNVYTKNFISIPIYVKYNTLEYSRVSFKLKKIFIGE